MPEMDQYNGKKESFVIFHGYIHVLPKEDENEINNFNKKKLNIDQ